MEIFAVNDNAFTNDMVSNNSANPAFWVNADKFHP
jgi:hypothetical protein